MAPWLLVYILSSSEQNSEEFCWRLLLGLGALPAAVVVLLSVLESFHARNPVTKQSSGAPSVAQRTHGEYLLVHQHALAANKTAGLGDLPVTNPIVAMSSISDEVAGDEDASSNSFSDIDQLFSVVHTKKGVSDAVTVRLCDSSGQQQSHVSTWQLLRRRDIQLKLLVTGGTWFLYDVAYCKQYV